MVRMIPCCNEALTLDALQLIDGSAAAHGKRKRLVGTNHLRCLTQHRFEKASDAGLERLGRRRDLVDEPKRARLGCLQHFGAKNMQQRLRWPEQPHQIGAAAEAGTNAESSLD